MSLGNHIYLSDQPTMYGMGDNVLDTSYLLPGTAPGTMAPPAQFKNYVSQPDALSPVISLPGLVTAPTNQDAFNQQTAQLPANASDAAKGQRAAQAAAQDAANNAPPLQLTGIEARVYKALNSYIPDPPLQFVYILCYFESGAFSNTLTKVDNNPGSIMWYKGAKKGTYVASNKTYATHFNSLDAFAKQMKYELSKGARPIVATTLDDFVHRLKLNGYFPESEAAYLKGLQGAAQRLRIRGYLQGDKQRIVMPSKKVGPLGWLGITVLGFLAASALFRAASD